MDSVKRRDERIRGQAKKNWADPMIREKMLTHLKTFSKAPKVKITIIHLSDLVRMGLVTLQGKIVRPTGKGVK